MSEIKNLKTFKAFDLNEAMCNFYLLERMASDGRKAADNLLKEEELRIAKVFVDYTIMICGGELRLTEEGEGGHDPYDCSYCEWRACGCDDEFCDEGNWAYCSDWTNGKVWEGFPPELKDFMNENIPDGDTVPHRSGLWGAFPPFVEEHGPIAMRWAQKGFSDGRWNSACGGMSWSKIARLTADYMEHKISTRVYVNMAWSMQHNGGTMFNKVEWKKTSNNTTWDYENLSILMELLEQQAVDNYAALLDFAAKPIARMYRDHRRWVTLNTGRKVKGVPGAYDPGMDLVVYSFRDRSPEWLGATFDALEGSDESYE